jgi:cysteine desulfurase
MQPFWMEHFLLPTQGHPNCQIVADSLERAREGVAELIGCDAFEVVFTSGGTEANNIAILGLASRVAVGHLLVSAIEHDSVWNSAHALAHEGWDIEVVPVGSDGVVNPVELEGRLRSTTRLVCLQGVNGVLGRVQPVREVADLCHSRGIPIHCDATQMAGKLPIQVHALRADSLAISGHRFYGPKGSGALYVRRGYGLAPLQYGEPRELGLRPGTENIAGWIGLGAAAKLAARCVDEAAAKLACLRDRFLVRCKETIENAPWELALSPSSLTAQSSTIRSFEERATLGFDNLPNTLILEWPREIGSLAKAAKGVIVGMPRASNPADEITRCLAAVGLPPERINRCMRLSFGWTTSEEQIDRGVEILAEAWDHCRQK